MTKESDIYTFVMPHFSRTEDDNLKFLKRVIQSIFDQSDGGWHLIIIDDASTNVSATNYIDLLKSTFPDRMSVIKNAINLGPGQSRNLGVDLAHRRKSPVVMYIDSDDICHKDRIKVTREIFDGDENASLVYSTFEVIDEFNTLVDYEKLSPSIREILDAHKVSPPQGTNAWIEIGTVKGYSNLTSSTSVKTNLAHQFPFPPERISEDTHAWYRYSAGGGDFVYTNKIPSLYRIPYDTEGSSSRAREGGKHNFYLRSVEVDEDGFKQAIQLALQNKKIMPGEVDAILVRFYLKQCETMFLENEEVIAISQLSKALNISPSKTKDLFREYSCHSFISRAMRELNSTQEVESCHAG